VVITGDSLSAGSAPPDRRERLWLDQHHRRVDAMGSKGIGEIDTTGTAAAVVNTVWHATGVRVRDLPVTLDKVLAGLP
jgi:xanthine dehydrogenase YagR molybdenum-binding subunit